MTAIQELSKKERQRAANRKHYHANKDYHRDRQRAWRAAQDPEKIKAIERKSRLKNVYGLTPEAYELLFASQNNCCAVCKSDNSSSSRDWHIDHCHKSKAVRGILCHHCNTLLGLARDNPDILSSAISYLKDFEARQRVH